MEAHFNLGAGEATASQEAINFAFTFPMLRALFAVEDEDLPFDETLVRDFRRKYHSNKTPRLKALAQRLHSRPTAQPP